MKRLFILFLTLCGLALPAARAQLYIGLHGGATLPTGYYADSKLADGEWMLQGTNQMKVGAGAGFSAGLDVAYAMPFLTDLSVIVEAEFMQSEPNKDVKEWHSKHGTEGEYTLPKYRNIPILAGVRYSYPIGKYYDLFGEVLGGVNIRTITPYTKGLITNTYDNATTMAFRIGAGIVVRDMVTLGAGFTSLGKAPLTGDYDSAADQKYNIVKATMVTVSLGFRINVIKGLNRTVQDY